MCGYVCMYMYTCVYLYVFTYKQGFLHIYIYIYIYIHIQNSASVIWACMQKKRDIPDTIFTAACLS